MNIPTQPDMKLEEAKQTHSIRTHVRGFRFGKTGPAWRAELWRNHVLAGTGYGETERDAVVNLCDRFELPCEL